MGKGGGAQEKESWRDCHWATISDVIVSQVNNQGRSHSLCRSRAPVTSAGAISAKEMSLSNKRNINIENLTE